MVFFAAQGTVGASGDLAPLAHLAQGVIGEGTMWSPKTGWGEALEVLAANNMVPYQLTPKDGLSLINGTQFICGVSFLSSSVTYLQFTQTFERYQECHG